MATEALVTGKLLRAPEQKVSAKNVPYVLLLVKQQDEILCRAFLFGEDGDEVLKLDRGDGVALIGTLSLGVWEKQGVTVPSMSLLAHRCISPATKKPKRQMEEKNPYVISSKTVESMKEAGRISRANDVAGLGNDLPWEQK